MAQQPRCEWCRHWRFGWDWGSYSTGGGTCALGKPLVPCSEYEREPGADG
jgi:hypothetical protein